MDYKCTRCIKAPQREGSLASCLETMTGQDRTCGQIGEAHSAKGGGTGYGASPVSEQQDCILEELSTSARAECGGKMGGWQRRMGKQAWTRVTRDPQEDPKTL